MTVKMVDAVIQYDKTYHGSSYIFVIRNALHVPSMTNNLVPPFMLQEAGTKVNEVPKIQKDDPNMYSHAIIFPETCLHIPLELWGTFSYFPLSKPIMEILMDPPDVYMLSPANRNTSKLKG